MTTLLKIDVSPRGHHSVSRALTEQFAAKWKESHAGGKVIERDLATTHLPFVEMPWIAAAFSDSSTHNEEQKAALKIGNEMIAELKDADEWLIATPMYNFAVPAKLKAYIDHVVRVGQTFSVKSDGSYAGLVAGKKATVIISSAGEYLPGTPTAAYDAVMPYLRAVIGFIGVTDVEFIHAGGTSKVDRGIEQLEQFVGRFSGQVAAAASK